jgi:hypothetical protein
MGIIMVEMSKASALHGMQLGVNGKVGNQKGPKRSVSRFSMALVGLEARNQRDPMPRTSRAPVQSPPTAREPD